MPDSRKRSTDRAGRERAGTRSGSGSGRRRTESGRAPDRAVRSSSAGSRADLQEELFEKTARSSGSSVSSGRKTAKAGSSASSGRKTAKSGGSVSYSGKTVQSGSSASSGRKTAKSAGRTEVQAGKAAAPARTMAQEEARESQKRSDARRKALMKRRKEELRRRTQILVACALLFILVVAVSISRIHASRVSKAESAKAQTESQSGQTVKPAAGGNTQAPTVTQAAPTVTPTVNPTGTPAATPTPAQIPAGKDVSNVRDQEIEFHPHSTENTDPSRLIAYTEVMKNDELIEDRSSVSPWTDITFGVGEDYTAVDGIVTFRGTNFRNSPQYGFADMKNYNISNIWTKGITSLTSGGRNWSGSGWTGQPLMEKWTRSQKAAMNMYDWAKEDDELVEVIHACLDGYIYFYDLRTGESTRDALYLGYTFKGSGALDPRGYPILYVGSGYDSDIGVSHVFVINLIDQSVMYEFGADDPFSLRPGCSFFDSSALVDAETDTLIYPGESGILYLIKLNSVYDEAAGVVSIDPGDIIRWHYYGTRSGDGSFWLGMEDSACVYKGYLFVCDNGGNMMCLDLRTMELVWVQDILDDSNGTPVLSIENGHLYLYVGTSFHLGWRSDSTAPVPIWKIDAENGEIVWQTDFECHSEEGVSGGIQSTVAVGKYDFSDYVYVTVAKTNDYYTGQLVCLRKDSGEIVWEQTDTYTWSSPVCVYNRDGSGAVLYFTFGGDALLIDGLTGEEKCRYSLGEQNIEASPAVYENYVVVGSRSCNLFGFKLD